MATLDTVVIALDAYWSGAGFTHLETDYLSNLDRVGATNDAFQIRAQYENREFEDSNQPYWRCSVELVFLRQLVNLENTYTPGGFVPRPLVTTQTVALDPDWWRGLTPAIHELTDGPEMEDDVERIGNVMRWSMKVAFLLTP